MADSKATSKAQAIALGLSTFFTGKPCRYKHISERYTTSGNCIQCRKEKSAERAKEQYEQFATESKAILASLNLPKPKPIPFFEPYCPEGHPNDHPTHR